MATVITYPSGKDQLLTEAEKETPHMVIGQFFDYAHLPEIKEMLREVFVMMINKNYSYLPASPEHDDMIYFFEKLEKMVEAVHILNKRETITW